MKLGVDLDGCLADFNSAYGELLIKVTGKDLLPEGWKTDPEFPGVWQWERAAGYNKEEEAIVWGKYITSQGIFWEHLDSLPGATETIRMLNKLAHNGHDVYFLTHRMGWKAKLQTERWLHGRGMDYPTVIMSGDKGPIIESLDLDFFVDDKLSTINEVRDRLDGNGLYLIDAPYNREGRLPGYKVASSVKDALVDFGVWQE